MKNVTFLIGNGFDLSFGLNSQYQNICKAYSEAQTSSDVLVKNFKEEITHWSNFEMDLTKFAAKCSTETDVINCLRNFKQFTEDYLTKEQDTALYDRMRDPKDMQKALAEFAISLEEFYTNNYPNITTKIESILSNEQINYHFITFNYTAILDFLIDCVKYSLSKGIISPAIHIHGKLPKNVTFGIDNEQQLPELPYSLTERGRRALIKPVFNSEFDKQRMESAQQVIKKSDVLCIYGLSLGDSDLMWRKAICDWMIDNPQHHTFLYIHDASLKELSQADERMDYEEDIKESIFKRWGIENRYISPFSNQLHIPISKNIFNFHKISENILGRYLNSQPPPFYFLGSQNRN